MEFAKLREIADLVIRECSDRDITCITVGSISYTEALFIPEAAEYCEDFDLIVIYDDVEKLNGWKLLNDDFLECSKAALRCGEADLFATKAVIKGVNLSVDFVSDEYLRRISLEEYTGYNKYRRKLSDAIENNLCLTSFNFEGKPLTYAKEIIPFYKYNIYILPIHLFDKGIFYGGVLINKLLNYPLVLCSYKNITENHIKRIQHRYTIRFIKEKRLNNACEFTKAIRLFSKYSTKRKNQIRDFIKILLTKKIVLITGSSGFIGSYLAQKLSKEYIVIGIDLSEDTQNNCFLSYSTDIIDYAKINDIFSFFNFDYVIHTAAEKTLQKCENYKEHAYKTNCLATFNLFEHAKQQNAEFIYISSDQIFDGSNGMYTENSNTCPINNYGYTKAICEEFLKHSSAAICRTALVFGEIPLSRASHFSEVKDLATLEVQSFFVQQTKYRLENNKEILLPSDEYVSPTHINLLYRQINVIMKKRLSGVFHCCGSERISRYEFGEAIASFYGLDCKLINGAPTSDKLRPKDVSLNIKQTEKIIGFKFDDIKMMLSLMEGDNGF